MTDQKPQNNRNRRRNDQPRRPARTVTTNVGAVFLEAQERKRAQATEAMRRIAGAK